jgi:hypothetical protein
MPTRTHADQPGTKVLPLRLLILFAFVSLLAGAASASVAPPSLAEERAPTDPETPEQTPAESAADRSPEAYDGTEGQIEASRSQLGRLPVARDDSYNVSQDKTRVVKAPGVIANDSKRRPVYARFVLGVEYGELSLNRYGGFTYTPDPNFRGIDYFKYRICERRYPSRCSAAAVVKLTVQGAAPVALADSFRAKKNRTKAIGAPGVLGNDHDPNGDTLRVISYTQPRRGGVVVYGGGGLRFRPDRNFTGKTRFTYWIGDGTGLRDSAQVTMRVRG